MTKGQRLQALSILGICGSLRKQSTNMGLLRYAQQQAPAEIEIQIADLAEVPFYNADFTEKPAAVTKLLGAIEQADACQVHRPGLEECPRPGIA